MTIRAYRPFVETIMALPFFDILRVYFLQMKNNTLRTTNQAFSYYSYRNLVFKKMSKIFFLISASLAALSNILLMIFFYS